MQNKDYTCSFTANVTATETFKKISQVSSWWVNQVDGKAEKLDDVFTMHTHDTWVAFKITECIPNKKVVWHVTDCFLHWINDKTEWKGTDIIFELTEKDGSTTINFTHKGLIPGAECYNDCQIGWDGNLKGSLLPLLNKGKGFPGKY